MATTKGHEGPETPAAPETRRPPVNTRVSAPCSVDIVCCVGACGRIAAQTVPAGGKVCHVFAL